VADGLRGLKIMDVSNPASPSLAGSLDTLGFASKVAVSGDFAFVAGGELKIVDVSDPTSPSLVGRLTPPGGSSDVAASGYLAFVASGSRGLQIVRPNPPLADLEWHSDESMSVTVPSGFSPGPYDVRVTNAEPDASLLDNGFLACERYELSAELEPVLPPGRGPEIPPEPLAPEPIPWRLVLDGDEMLFRPSSRHGASLRLPALPGDLEVRFEPGDGSGRTIIELQIAPPLDLGQAVLVSDDPTEAERLWNEALSAGGFEVPKLDDHSHGDLILEVYSNPTSEAPPWEPIGGLPGEFFRDMEPSVRYRYDLSTEGRLTDARAWGPGVDLEFEAVATDLYRCETAVTVGFLESREEVCEELAAAHPELALLCQH
jgi:hypothetical protein